MNTFLIVSLIIIVILIIWIISIYNSLISNIQKVKEGWSGIDVQLKRRSNLIPNLVETVKGYTKHEDKVLTEVTKFRSQCQKVDSNDVDSRGIAESMLSGALGKLMLVAEEYPDLKSSSNFSDLHKSLDEIEEEIQLSRRYYNGSVRDMNILVKSFPSNIIANMFSFQSANYFEIENAADREVVKVKFD